MTVLTVQCNRADNFRYFLLTRRFRRMASKNKVFGVLDCSLPSTKLPTCEDIIKAVCFERSDKRVTVKDAIDSVTKQVIELWQRADISTVSKRRVNARISDYFEKYTKLCYANTNRDSNHESFKVKIVHLYCEVISKIFQQFYVQLVFSISPTY